MLFRQDQKERSSIILDLLAKYQLHIKSELFLLFFVIADRLRKRDTNFHKS